METIARIAKDFPGKELKELPLIASLRLAVNVAACDNQPLVVIRAKDEANRKKLESILRECKLL